MVVLSSLSLEDDFTNDSLYCLFPFLPIVLQLILISNRVAMTVQRNLRLHLQGALISFSLNQFPLGYCLILDPYFYLSANGVLKQSLMSESCFWLTIHFQEQKLVMILAMIACTTRLYSNLVPHDIKHGLRNRKRTSKDLNFKKLLDVSEKPGLK